MFRNLKKTALIGALIMTAGTAAAEYPEKPIEVIVGFSAGGGTDVMARTVAPFLEKYLGDGASVVVKNVPGASGQIGVTETAEADPDGYTIGTYNLPGMMARTLDREAGYDADSFTYLANVVNDPNVIVTSKASGLDTFDKLLEAAKAEPGAVTVGMSSLGGDDHFMLTKLQNLTETEFTIVPFRGSAPARTALMGGHVAMGILNISEVASFKDEINILGIAQNERSDFAPDVATFKEQGVDLINGSMRGFVAPAGLPEDVSAKLLEAFGQLASDEEFAAAMTATANPVEVVVGADFQSLNAETLDLAKTVWDETPWQ
ncbi:tripartite tricarboxylate transporter substrate binding protein [Paracoccus sp. SCSIO 75233]|uniref:Bug family tripartite tricarboxylate transporter substrate binding protein n=1 Tax=Paracoccus sp. SCSIO 75233 TaxID=3017782 RepID=UPI0022EFF46A|nr:tripartite tricarboxylate transporter substrate binding protein [Paracoccus sp. SCSIO 75233]WBU53981.1 tripartite tricarboxylate transporter substrate binding protein [Paracoccus sp. SCSIO 75233]